MIIAFEWLIWQKKKFAILWFPPLQTFEVFKFIFKTPKTIVTALSVLLSFSKQSFYPNISAWNFWTKFPQVRVGTALTKFSNRESQHNMWLIIISKYHRTSTFCGRFFCLVFFEKHLWNPHIYQWDLSFGIGKIYFASHKWTVIPVDSSLIQKHSLQSCWIWQSTVSPPYAILGGFYIHCP